MAKKNQNTETGAMNWKDFLYLINSLKNEKEYLFMLLIGIGCYCGLRISDILSLKWSDLLHKGNIEIKEKKTGKSRKITINQSLQELIEYTFIKKSAEIKIGNYIFANKCGKPYSIQYINRRLHNIFDIYNISIKNGSSHSLRKTFGKRVWEMNDKSEASLVLLSQIFNHSSIAITKRYIGITEENIENVYLSL